MIKKIVYLLKGCIAQKLLTEFPSKSGTEKSFSMLLNFFRHLICNRRP